MESYELPNGEIAVQIVGFEDYYVTQFGNIYSTRWRNRNARSKNTLGVRLPQDLKPVKLSVVKSRRYNYANIYTNTGGRASIRVHRLVYQYHNKIGDCLLEGFVIDHIDNNPLNNHIDNLQQITQSDNIKLYYDGLLKTGRRVRIKKEINE
jgi:hypothetical protein